MELKNGECLSYHSTWLPPLGPQWDPVVPRMGVPLDYGIENPTKISGSAGNHVNLELFFFPFWPL